MPRCKCCGDWIAPWWMDWAVLIVAMVLCAGFVISACATRTVSISPDGTMNATSTVLLYCPAAEATKLANGNRTAEALSDSSGVGGTVQGLGSQVVEVLKP